MIARMMPLVIVESPMRTPSTNEHRPRTMPSMINAITRVTTAAGASADDVAWTVTKRLPSSAASPPGYTSARSIRGRALATPSRFAPREVGRDLGAEKRLERDHVCGDPVADLLEEDPIERHERDGLPHARPSSVPRFDAHVVAECPAYGALARAKRGKETRVRQGVGFEVEPELDHPQAITYPGLVVQLLVAGPELRHVRVRDRVERWPVGGNLLQRSRDDAAQEDARIEPGECGRCGRGR